MVHLAAAFAIIALAVAAVVLVSRAVLGMRLPPFRREAAADVCAFASSAEWFGMSPAEAARIGGASEPAVPGDIPQVRGLPAREQEILDRVASGQLGRAMAVVGFAASWPSRRRPLFIFPVVLVALIFGVWYAVLALVVPFFSDIYNQLGAELPWLTQVLVEGSTHANSEGPVVFALLIAAGLAVVLWRSCMFLASALEARKASRSEAGGAGCKARGSPASLVRAGMGRSFVPPCDIHADLAEPGELDRCASISRRFGVHCAWRAGRNGAGKPIEGSLMPESAVQANSGAAASQFVLAFGVTAVLCGIVAIALYLPLFAIPILIGRP